MEFTKRFLPTFKKANFNFNREAYAHFSEVYWLQTILVTCFSSIALGIPAYVIKFAYDNGIFSFYILALLLAVPWFLVPTVFLLYLANNSKPARIATYSMIGILALTFIIWIVCLFQL